jgi:hypothetical protein
VRDLRFRSRGGNDGIGKSASERGTSGGGLGSEEAGIDIGWLGL